MTPPRKPTMHAVRMAAGLTLVELLVSLTIAMVLTLAVSNVMLRHERDKRELVGGHEVLLNANFLGMRLDRDLRGAGSGLAQAWQAHFGCRLHVARNGTTLLPRGDSFPAPFAGVPGQMRLAPLMIHAGAGAGGSDVLSVFSGASGRGETAQRILPGSISGSGLRLPTTVGWRGGDLLLLAEEGRDCMVQQLASPFTGGASQQLDLDGTYTRPLINGLDITGYGATAHVAQLGNPSGNPPAFQLMGIGENDTLYELDLLRLDGADQPQPLAQGVADLRAVYGVDSNGDGRVDNWVSPSSAGYQASDLSDGSQTARDRLASILAVRVGLVLRTDRIERELVAPATLTLFQDLDASLQHVHAISADRQHIRHRTLELTVPLLNVIHQART